MESLLVGSFHQPSSLISFPVTSLPLVCRINSFTSHVKKREAFSNLDKQGVVSVAMQLGSRNSVKQRVGLSRKRGLKFIVNSATGHSLESQPSDDPRRSVVPNAIDAFYRFSRPHTVVGTALSIISVSLLAVEKLSDFSPLFFTGVLEAIVAALLMNIYIVGLNQLSDIEIDKVNKPYLPLASGEYSVSIGVMIVSSFAILVGKG